MINDFSNQDTESLIADLQSQIDRLGSVLSRSQNLNNVGVGQTLPAQTLSGQAVPPVSAVVVVPIGNMAGLGLAACTWLNPVSSTPVDRYNIYVQNALPQQTQEILVASVHTPPAVFTYVAKPGQAVQVIVQTVLANGQSNPIPQCPSSTIVSVLLPIFANNAAAVAAGKPVGSEYRLGGDPDQVCIVH